MRKIFACILFVLMVTPLVLPTTSDQAPSQDIRKVITVVIGR